MIRKMQIKNFKSWQNTGPFVLAPLTGFFGANSSGKTSLLQFLLLLKQSVDDPDPRRLIFLGNDESLVNLGSFTNMVFEHDVSRGIEFLLVWDTDLKIAEYTGPTMKMSARLDAEATQAGLPPEVITQYFEYELGVLSAEMRLSKDRLKNYVFEVKQSGVQKYSAELPEPDKFYQFPAVLSDYHNISREFFKFGRRFYELFRNVLYLGPLRDPPKTIYAWNGGKVSGVGSKGENTIAALLSTRYASGGHTASNIEREVAEALKRMGLIYDFVVEAVGSSADEYAVRIKQSASSPEVPLRDVGFGVSQVLPVITLCYTAPENSVLLLEQPELHLHPAVQYVLADILMEAVQKRHLQIIFESHSEHLLQRIQRRIAEGQYASQDAVMYFTERKVDHSTLTLLKLDELGNISNWPKDFFGDLMGEVSARTLAAIDRSLQDKK